MLRFCLIFVLFLQLCVSPSGNKYWVCSGFEKKTYICLTEQKPKHQRGDVVSLCNIYLCTCSTYPIKVSN